MRAGDKEGIVRGDGENLGESKEMGLKERVRRELEWEGNIQTKT